MFSPCKAGAGPFFFKCIMNCLKSPLLIKQVFDNSFGLKEDWICLFACGEVSDFEVEIRQISVNWQRPVQTDTPPPHMQAGQWQTSSEDQSMATRGYFSSVLLCMPASSLKFESIFFQRLCLFACCMWKHAQWYLANNIRDGKSNNLQLFIKNSLRTAFTARLTFVSRELKHSSGTIIH